MAKLRERDGQITITLTEDELNTVSSALSLAGDVYNRHARDLRTVDVRMADQFDRQCEACRVLWDSLN